MTVPADAVTARFAQIQADREAATAATRTRAEESRKATDAAGAAVHAKARNRLSALRRRAADRREGWGRDAAAEDIEIGVVDDEDEDAVEAEAVLPLPPAPGEDEGDEAEEGRDWLR